MLQPTDGVLETWLCQGYDRVNWGFLFDFMERLGIAQEFIWIVRLFFQEANVGVSFNGSTAAPFKIQHGVRQGCTFCPISFPLIGRGPKCNGETRLKS